MTINKSQGQTLGMAGLDLRTDVFSHGQLYVALSRFRLWDSIVVLLHDDSTDRRIKNIVFKEVFIWGYEIRSLKIFLIIYIVYLRILINPPPSFTS